jgi:tetratricopeptide (TPR) repeat protein
MAPGAGALEAALAQARLALQHDRPAEAERIAGELLKKNARHPGARHVLGAALLMQGRAEEAIAPLEDAARAEHSAQIDTELAIALRQAGRVDDALARLRRATKRQPPFGPAYHELAFLLFTLKRLDEAIEALRRGIEVAPMMPELSIQLGYLLNEAGDRTGAKAAFGRALSINPGYSDAIFGLAMAHFQGGEYAAAAQHLRAYLVSRPDDHSAWLNLGHCLLETGEREAAYGCLRRAARVGPKRYGLSLHALVKSGHGRFWLRPSDAVRFIQGE